MSTNLVATWRIKYDYTFQNRLHTCHLYCKGATDGGGGVFSIDSRTSPGSILVSDAAAQMAQAVFDLGPAGLVNGQAFLEHLESLVWVTKQVLTPNPSNVSPGTAVPASQFTLTLRCGNNHKVKFVVEDTSLGYPAKYLTATAGPGPADASIAHFISSASDPQDPFFWMVGRDETFLDSSSFVRASVYPNRKIVRAAGL